MGKTPEPGNDVPVADRKVQAYIVGVPTIHREPPEQRHAFVLVGKRLTMHQRHVEEGPLIESEFRVKVLRKRMARVLQAHIVGRPGERRFPIYVSRKLIDQDDHREATLRHVAPARETTRMRRLDRIRKPVSNNQIEGIAAIKPVFPVGFVEPEVQNLVRHHVLDYTNHHFLATVEVQFLGRD